MEKSGIFVKSTTDFSQDPQKRPVASGVISFQFFSQGSGMEYWIDFAFIINRFFDSTVYNSESSDLFCLFINLYDYQIIF